MTLPTTRREDLLTSVFGAWLVVGLFVDAFNHVTNPDLESFWTPWHALFYSGFAACAAWIVVVVLRRRRPEGTALDWAPPGYRLALIGIGVFAVGAVGDAIWHTTLGVETSLDALLSPTHLLLWIGGLLLITAPVRRAWVVRDRSDTPGYREFLPVIVAMSLAVATVAFFFVYAWNLSNPWSLRTPYIPNLGLGDERAVVIGILGVLVQTGALIVPLLLARRRWTLPFGTATTVFVFATAAMAIGFDGQILGLPAALASGIVFDFTAGRHRLLAPVLTPLSLFGIYFAIVGATGRGIGWPVEVWSGAIALAVLLSVATDLALAAVEGLREVEPTFVSS